MSAIAASTGCAATGGCDCGRRALIRRGLGLGAVAIAAPLLLTARDAVAANSGDAEVLAAGVTLERIAVLAYGEMLEGGLLSPRLQAVVRSFRDHEQEHVDALVTALDDLGGSVPAEPSATDVERVVKGIGDMKTQADVLNAAIELEQAEVAAYHDAQRRLVDGKLLQTEASIMAAQAQHLVVLREAAGREPVPSAFEDGSGG